MYKTIYILFVSILFISTIICILASLGTSVSKKYEVDEAYAFLDMNKTLSPLQKRQAELELDAKGRKLQNTILLLYSGAAISFFGGCTLLIYRTRLLNDHIKPGPGFPF
jgi:hypothetical protein